MPLRYNNDVKFATSIVVLMLISYELPNLKQIKPIYFAKIGIIISNIGILGGFDETGKSYRRTFHGRRI